MTSSYYKDDVISVCNAIEFKMARSIEDAKITIAEVYKDVLHISSLAHYARVQANEAEMKARHARSLADRACCEAECVKQVAESLSHTAHAVAKMALELTNKTESFNSPIDDPEISERDDTLSPQLRTNFKSTTEKKINNIVRDDVRDNTDASYQKMESNSCGFLTNTSNPGTSLSPHSSSKKYTEAFPEKTPSKESLPKEIDSSHSLPIVWENTYQGGRESKPLLWTEKKSMRKIQRKFKNIDTENTDICESSMENVTDEYSIPTETPQLMSCCTGTENDKLTSTSTSGEKVVQNVRFSENGNSQTPFPTAKFD